jgi:hypothetical protein
MVSTNLFPVSFVATFSIFRLLGKSVPGNPAPEIPGLSDFSYPVKRHVERRRKPRQLFFQLPMNPSAIGQLFSATVELNPGAYFCAFKRLLADAPWPPPRPAPNRERTSHPDGLTRRFFAGQV